MIEQPRRTSERKFSTWYSPLSIWGNHFNTTFIKDAIMSAWYKPFFTLMTYKLLF